MPYQIGIIGETRVQNRAWQMGSEGCKSLVIQTWQKGSKILRGKVVDEFLPLRPRHCNHQIQYVSFLQQFIGLFARHHGKQQSSDGWIFLIPEKFLPLFLWR
jgi:hypothetical protein